MVTSLLGQIPAITRRYPISGGSLVLPAIHRPDSTLPLERTFISGRTDIAEITLPLRQPVLVVQKCQLAALRRKIRRQAGRSYGRAARRQRVSRNHHTV